MRTLSGIFAIFAFLTILNTGSGRAADRIEWQLENPFRLFKNPEDTQLHMQLYQSLSRFDRRTPILTVERELEKRFGGRGWAERVFNNTCYNQTADRYNACKNYVLPKSHRIIASLKAKSRFWEFLGDDNFSPCRWTLSRLDGEKLAEKSAPCRSTVSFDIPYPGGARLLVSRNGRTRSAAETIKIRDLLIVGMGDSFGAGEGNPDDPVKFNDRRSHNYGKIELAETGKHVHLSGYPARAGNWTKLNGASFRRERARWWDRQCHRSLYSHQVRAALQLAIENPKRAVTFLNFSCAGAEILYGLLMSAPVRECTPGNSHALPPQISSLSRELCNHVTGNKPLPATIIQKIPELRDFSESDLQINRCRVIRKNGRRQRDLKRPIDVLMLSIGGNDVGFTPLVADSILSATSIYRRLGSHTGAVYNVKQARKKLQLIKKRLKGLRFALKLFFGLTPDTKVILTGYPNMGYGADGMSTCGGTKGMEVFPAFKLNREKVGAAERFAQKLNKSLDDFAGREWTYVNGFHKDFRSRGLCAENGDGPAEALGLPRKIKGQWTPYPPSHYAAYIPRQRWFRTPNDAFLASHMHAQAVSSFGAQCSGIFSGTLRTLARQHWEPFQLFLASTFGGAFHPTAEGQARMADEVVKALRGKF